MFGDKNEVINHYENKVITMVMRIKFVKELNEENGLKTNTNEPFLPNINDLIYTVILPPESGSHNEMHNLVCGRISDEKDKGAVYAGI